MKNLYKLYLTFWNLIKNSHFRGNDINKPALSSGFSILELMTVVGMILVISAIALPMYSKYQTRAIQGRMQHEIAEVRKSLAYAHSVDGGYHQRIYTAGYKPDQDLIAEVGMFYTRSNNPCCNLFPNFSSSADFSNFFTIKNTTLVTNVNASTRASHICDGGKCKINADCVPSGSGVDNVQNRRLSPMSLSGCGGTFSGQTFTCNCENYRIYAINKWKGKNLYLFANQEGKLCASTDGSTVQEF